MKLRRWSAPSKIKAPSSSSALKTLTSSSSSSDKAPSFETLINGDKDYFITDIPNTYDIPSSEDGVEDNVEFGRILKRPILLKDVLFKPDSKIISILNSSETLTQLPPSGPGPAPATDNRRRPTFNKMTLVIGDLKYCEDGHEIDCSNVGRLWMTIPFDHFQRIKNITTLRALFILLVPNDFILKTLADELFPKRFPCIVLTARGPTDLLIRMENELNLPVLALVNSDPKSLKMLAFFGRRLKNLKWLGIRPTDMVGFKRSTDYCTSPMTDKDINIADKLLKDPYIKNRPQWSHELSFMLKMKLKLELDTTCCFYYLTQVFLPMKLQMEDWI